MALSAQADQEGVVARIVAVRAMPYYPDTGTIRRSTDLFDRRLVLRNVVFPSGPTGDPLRRNTIEDWDIVFGTTATYVEVEVYSANFDSIPAGTHVEANARVSATGRQLMTSSVSLSGLLTRSGHVLHIPFLVYGTGCEPLEIRVKLLAGSRILGASTKTIPFSCGE